jgi:D-alanyl-D-alanine carboxypeptidase (penicillin-binding protein 5/6)
VRDSAVDGLKTGHTEEAGYCLVASAEKNGMRLISVIMGTDSSRMRTQESLKLLNYGFRFFSSHKLYDGNQKLDQVRVWKGVAEQLDLGLAEDLYLSVLKGQEKDLVGELIYPSILEAPFHPGQQVGVLKVKLDQEVIAERPLIALTEMEASGFFARLWDTVVLFFKGLFS